MTRDSQGEEADEAGAAMAVSLLPCELVWGGSCVCLLVCCRRVRPVAAHSGGGVADIGSVRRRVEGVSSALLQSQTSSLRAESAA